MTAQVSVQIGFKKSYKETQRVEAKLNGDKLTWTKSGDTYNGEFITPTANRKTECLFMALLDCEDGDVLELETSVFMSGRGPDEERTRSVRFHVSEMVEPIQYEIPKFGANGYPLVSGRLTQVFEKKMIQDRLGRVDSLIDQTQY